MSKLPHVNNNRVPAWQTRRLERWLDEWNIELALRAEQGDAEDSAVDYETVPEPFQARAEHDIPPACGQVRLLNPALTAHTMRPVFVALLSKRKHDRFHVAPYGRFAEPASPAELLTDRDTPALGVLCLWNSEELTATEIEQSWYVDTLSEQEVADALAVYRHQAGAPLPASLEERVGPPLSHPLDPRYDYQDEERELWALDRADESGWSDHLAKAADPPDRGTP